MQSLSVALQAELNKGQAEPRVLLDLFELYSSDAIPGVTGFSPSDALEKFAAQQITWNGIAYRREVVSRGDINRNMGEKTNSVTVTFSNISRYLATLAQSQTIEGMILVIRCVCPTVTDDSIVLFVGRCDKPSDITKKEFTLDARQDFGNINQTLPPRKYTADDPEGRLPGDPLYEGIQFHAVPGNYQWPTVNASTSFFGRLTGRRRTDQNNLQWSSIDATPYGQVIREAFGRCQFELRPFIWADKGVYIGALWEICNGPIAGVENVKTRVEGLSDPLCTFLPTPARVHLGDLGGTGTNTGNTCQADIGGGQVFSHLAYVEGAIIPLQYFSNPSFSDPNVLNEPPLVTCLVKGRIVKTPDGSGAFILDGWSDNPVCIARFILTHPQFVNINEAFMEDSVNYQTALHCDEPLFDTSNGDVILVQNPDLSQAGTSFTRVRSTGLITPRYVRSRLLGEDIDPEFDDGPYVGFNPSTTPDIAIQKVLRKRYTCNVPITDEVRAVDILCKTILVTFKGFIKVNKHGKYELLSETASDATHLRSATTVGATSIPVFDVTPWKSGPELLKGRLLLGNTLITSEVRDVSSADYSSAGNSITLSASVSGGVTATASGANLSGGSTSVQASGTVTIGGTPAAGNTVTITIDGIPIVYTISSDDNTTTVAAMLVNHINATTRLRKYIKATWASGSPTVVTILCLFGALNLSSAALKAHTGPISDPSSAPTIAAASGGSLPAGNWTVAYADVRTLQASPLVQVTTALTPVSTVAVTTNQKINVSGLPAFPTGVVARYFYLSEKAGSTNIKYAVTRTDAADFSISSAPLPDAALPPSFNSTGEELLRVAMSFATNSQDIFPSWRASTAVILNDIYLPTTLNGHKYQVTTAGTTGSTEPSWPTSAGATVASGSAVFTEIGSTVLQQAGLTRANIVKDSFKWPMGSSQSSINQVKGSYRDAKNDFALTPYRVNDPVHQAQVKKTYPLEFDGTAIDNFHQFYRIANWLLSKNREGDWFNGLKTGPNGLVLEEGDVICSSDDSGGLINVATRIEDLRIHPNHEVSINQARKYSTLMFSDEVGTHSIPIASTLRFTQTDDTTFVPMDIPYWRDSDPQDQPGFHVAVSNSGNGDWRGTVIHSDSSGEYVAISNVIDVPVPIGSTLTALDAVTAIDAIDTVSDVRVQMVFPKTANPAFELLSTTEDKMLAGANKAAIGINGRWELIQFQTVTPVSDDTYDLSVFLRGRISGIENVANHAIADHFVLLTDSEGRDTGVKFIPIDQALLDVPIDLKAVTINQDVVDATGQAFTWTGQVRRAALPTDLNAVKDGSGDWHESAIGHPRESDKPETYIARQRKADGTFLRDIPATPGLHLAASLFTVIHAPLSVGGGSWSWGAFTTSNNNITGAVSWGGVYAMPPIEMGSAVSARVTTVENNDVFGDVVLSFGPKDYTDPRGSVDGLQSGVRFKKVSSSETSALIYDWSNNLFDTISVPTVDGIVFVRIVWTGTELRFQVSGSPINSDAPPNVILPDLPTPTGITYLRVAVVGTTTKVENITIGGSSSPHIIYSLSQQQNDNSGSDIAVGNLDVEMWQVSPYATGQKGFAVRKVF